MLLYFILFSIDVNISLHNLIKFKVSPRADKKCGQRGYSFVFERTSTDCAYFY